MSDELREQVRQTVADIFGVALPEVTDAPLTESIEGWDSVTHLNMILALEQKFGVSFQADLLPELTSVGVIVEALGRQLER